MHFRYYLVCFLVLILLSCKGDENGIMTEEMLSALGNRCFQSDSIRNLNTEEQKWYSEVEIKRKGIYNELIIINNKDSWQSFVGSDGKLKYIQEALDKQGNWRPIEYWRSDWCGNTRKTVSVTSRMTKRYRIRKYAGNFKTKLRVKYQNEEEYFYSPEFEGEINLTQFVKPSNTKTFRLDKYNFLENILPEKAVDLRIGTRRK